MRLLLSSMCDAEAGWHGDSLTTGTARRFASCLTQLSSCRPFSSGMHTSCSIKREMSVVGLAGWVVGWAAGPQDSEPEGARQHQSGTGCGTHGQDELKRVWSIAAQQLQCFHAITSAGHCRAKKRSRIASG